MMKNKALLGVSVVVVLLFGFGALRYENFFSAYNLLEFGRYNSMFALISIGMAFVIMSGGIDLSVGTVAALGSVVSALLSPQSAIGAIAAGTLAGAACGLVNGLVITRMKIQPFIATLAEVGETGVIGR
jgi:ribose/xylose/arabinose/galactoside ABC-type transport system permease subunit